LPAQQTSLELWRHALVASVRGDAPDLSARQMALMLSVYLGEGPHTVRGLAHVLRISKPAVSRALDRLGELGYIRRQRDDMDRRNVLVQRTDVGDAFLIQFAALIDEARTHVDTPLSAPKAEVALNTPQVGINISRMATIERKPLSSFAPEALK
jgi:DNA-binding MarR family transcriptional regulator